MTTNFSPKNILELNSSNVNFRGTGVSGTGTAGTSTSIDYLVTEDRIITGAYTILKNHVSGDSITLRVMDLDGVIAPAGTTLNEFATNWYVASDTQTQRGVNVPYPAKCLAGLYIRIVYNSVGLINVDVRANISFHKILI